jgi:hypothetical protein
MNLPEQLLPESMQLLAEVIGLPDTLRLIELRGGLRVSVPKDPADTSAWLYGKLSGEAWALIVKQYGGEVIEVPICQAALKAVRDVAIAHELERGTGTARLAEQYKLTERGVRYIKGRIADRHSPDLFD